MTYKELVNSILAKLREDQISSVQESDYSKLVGSFVNDAKRIVEDAWPWRALRRTVNIPITAGSATYDLEDYLTIEGNDQVNERARIYRDPQTSLPNIVVTTSGRERELELCPISQDYLTNIIAQNQNSSGTLYGITLTANPGPVASKTNIRVATIPSVVVDNETIRIMLVNPQNDLAGDSENMLIPSGPVIQLAYLYCLYERGEEIGENLGLTDEKAAAALADAISLDSQDTSESVIQVY